MDWADPLLLVTVKSKISELQPGKEQGPEPSTVVKSGKPLKVPEGVLVRVRVTASAFATVALSIAKTRIPPAMNECFRI
jgi:hypothetical protein